MTCVVVGSIGLDSIETPTAKVTDVVGGSASYFANAAKHFCPVSVVGVVGQDFTAEHMKAFDYPQIDAQGIARKAGKTFRWAGRYNDTLSDRETLLTELNVFGEFRPEFPDSYLNPTTLFLANIDPDLQLEVLKSVTPKGIVAADTMNFWIDGKRERLVELLGRVDLAFINESEARSLSGKAHIPAAADELHRLGPKTIIVMRGDAGVYMSHEGNIFALPAFPVSQPFDTTGAGDSFAGGFMGYVTQQNRFDFATMKQALVRAAVVASFVLETFSVERTAALTPEQIASRIEQYRRVFTLES
jgi:sugar/nucleoside kinase (ribokinase family)